MSFEDGKKTLLQFYSDMQSALGTRLIGFVAGLFTLLQLVQYSKSAGLAEVFPIFQSWPDIGSCPKFIFLFIGVLILIVYIVRTIFRYAAYGGFANFAVGLDPIEVGDGRSVTAVVHAELVKKMTEPATKLYWLFPSSYFLSGGRTQNIYGWLISGSISLVITCVLLLLVS